MLVPVELRIPIPEGADAGDGLQVYSDFGDGTIDLARPLLARPAALFEAIVTRTKDFGGQGLRGTFPTGRPPTRLSEMFGRQPFGKGMTEFIRYVDVTVHLPAAYAMHKFAGQIVDAAGNAQGGTLPEIAVFVAATEPPTLSRFELESYDAVNDQAVFAFERNTE